MFCTHSSLLYLWSYLFHVLWLICFQVYFKPSHRLKGNRSLRRRQRLPLHSIILLILRRRSEQLSNFGIIFTHIVFAKGGESSYKGLIFHSSIRFWRFMPKGEKVLAQSKKTAPPPNFKKMMFSNWYLIVFKRGRKY
jgi:hypothetical protein